MKQILQDMAKGGTSVTEAPAPKVSKNTLLIDTKVSLISAGTERMLVEFGKASLLGKIKQQPDKDKMVLDKIKTDSTKSAKQYIKDDYFRVDNINIFISQ